jgi:hypothetical protein
VVLRCVLVLLCPGGADQMEASQGQGKCINAYVPLQSQAKKMVTSSDSREDDYVGALIYRESQLRKTEAAAAAESHRIQLGRDQPVKQDSISLLTMIQMSLET